MCTGENIISTTLKAGEAEFARQTVDLLYEEAGYLSGLSSPSLIDHFRAILYPHFPPYTCKTLL